MALAASLLGGWLSATPSGLLGKADAIGYAVCHRIDLRSLHLGERPLPLCARCTGMYLGSSLVLVSLGLSGRGRAGLFPSKRLLAVLGLFGMSFAIDGLNSYLHLLPGMPSLYEPHNAIRLVTGTLLGVALGTIVLPGFNQTAWKQFQPVPILQSFRDLAWLLLLASGLVGLALSGNPMFLYPLALISSAGVIALLTMVYTTMALLVLRRDGQAASWRDLAFPLLLGGTIAVGQIAAIDLGRYLLTGTWGGFSLPQ